MRNLKDIIFERLILSKNKKSNYTLFPKTKEELLKMVEYEIEKNGNECSLNHIDVSKITNMSFVFNESKFNGDISKWDVSNVTNMFGMFQESKFTGDNGDISNWDVSNVRDMHSMFEDSQFNGDISGWNVSNVEDMCGMFCNSKFTSKNGDISNWDVSNLKWTDQMFRYTPLQNNPPKWYKEE